ncbi:MAG: hypothetical protein QOK31_100 [Solirubrobacteraceae bacterium]|nr:hypothetical protein [Solirubrobacteraceae bacterium]
MGLAERWLAWGHRVTLLTTRDRAADGAVRAETLPEGLSVRRAGGRLTFPLRAAWALRRGLDPDVVVEVVDGPSLLSPLWLRKPRAALMGRGPGGGGRLATALLERLPLRLLYRGTTTLVPAQATRRALTAEGLPVERVHLVYPGVRPAVPAPARLAGEPRLICAGPPDSRTLDLLEAIPETVLDVLGTGAGDTGRGRRGLGERVIRHGAVGERQRAELYARAWLALPGSSHEESFLSALEAAAQGTPSAGLRTGALPEVILDGETGVLADDAAELAARVADLLARPAERDRLGDGARARARSFTWDRAAAVSLAVLDSEAQLEPEPISALVRRAGRSETAKAAGLAAAALGANVIALLFTLVFTRILGANRYGSLGTLINYFFVLSVFGQAMQVAAARETTLGRLGTGRALSATVTRWGRDLGLLCVALGLGAAVFRHQLASVTGVKEVWAAAAVLPTAGLWLLLSIERGVLQGLRAYRLVGASIVFEAVGRLITGLILVAPGLGVTGAFLGTPLSMLIMAVVLAVVLRRRLGTPPHEAKPHRLLVLLRQNWPSLVALGLFALLQTLDQLVIKHQIGGVRAGAYIAATVAAKAVIWVAIGVGLYLLPEATRLAAAGEDPRPALRKALFIIAAVATPALLIFLAIPKLLLRVAFGHPEYVQASSSLVILGAAFAVLALTYLSVQYLLALGRVVFVPLLAGVALAEVLVLLNAHSLMAFATTVLGMQCLAAVLVLGLSLRRLPRPVPARAVA